MSPVIPLGPGPLTSNALKMDAWSNFVTGLGQSGMDNVQSLVPDMPLRLTEVDLNNLWRGDGFARRIVEQPVYDGMRAGYTFNGLEESIEKMLHKRMHDLKVDSNLRNWWRWGRLHGGSVVFLGINDGQDDLATPFDPNQSNYKIMFLKVFDRWRVNPYPEVDMDPKSPAFGQVMLYKIAPLTGGSFDCHRSRLVIYDGEPITDAERLRQNRWGDSVITAAYTALRTLQNILMNMDHIVADMVQGVLKVNDLMGIIDGGQEGNLIARLKLMDLTKSTLRTVLVDNEEEYSRIVTTITGLEKLVDKAAESAAAQGNMPVKLFMGVAPAGLQATGDADIRQWYDAVHAQQEGRYEPALRQIVDLIAGEQNIELPEYDIKFNPLWQQDAKEMAETRFLHAQTDEKYLTFNVLTPEEVRKQRFGKPEYGEEINGVDIADEGLLPPDKERDVEGEIIPAGVNPTQNGLIPGAAAGAPAPAMAFVAPQQG